jgi:DNA-binding transcriptional ArsR family regulator
VDQYVKQFKALGDSTRFSIFFLLLQHEYCGTALARELQISESAVSQHLKILTLAGIVQPEKRGYYTHYLVDRGVISQLGEVCYALAATPHQEKDCKHKNQTCHTCQ